VVLLLLLFLGLSPPGLAPSEEPMVGVQRTTAPFVILEPMGRGAPMRAHIGLPPSVAQHPTLAALASFPVEVSAPPPNDCSPRMGTSGYGFAGCARQIR
jgi:hypothetical protein